MMRTLRIECRNAAGDLLWTDEATELDGHIALSRPRTFQHGETIRMLSEDGPLSTEEMMEKTIDADLVN